MAQGLTIRLAAEPVRTIAFGSIGAAYMGVGTSLDNACRIMFLQNLTDVGLMFSLDGITDHFPIPTEGFLLLDITSNKNLQQGFFISVGTRIYVKELTGAAPTSGGVYLSYFYGTGD